MNLDSKIYVAGHCGLVGSALMRALKAAGYTNIITRTRQELDLTKQTPVREFFYDEQPEYVFLAAARVGGIKANSTYPYDFIRDNLLIQSNVIESAFRFGTRKFLFLGSSCIYPRLAPQPIKEEYLLSSALEPTNEWYAVAKIAGIKMLQALRRQYGFQSISVMPTNLYGPFDNYNAETAHLLPAIIRRMHLALDKRKNVVIWGTGTPRRELMYVDDLAEACVFLMNLPSDEEILYEGAGIIDSPPELINIGTGEDLTIREIAQLVAEAMGYEGSINTDPEKPDGTPQKLLDVSKINALGWKARTPLREGIEKTVQWYLENEATQ